MLTTSDTLTANAVRLEEFNHFIPYEFMHGCCDGLAIALHDLTGWPLVAITDADSVYANDESLECSSLKQRAKWRGNEAGMTGALHWVVVNDNGKFVDVEGVHEPEVLVARYDVFADSDKAAAGYSDRDAALEEYIQCKQEPLPLSYCKVVAEFLLGLTELPAVENW